MSEIPIPVQDKEMSSVVRKCAEYFLSSQEEYFFIITKIILFLAGDVNVGVGDDNDIDTSGKPCLGDRVIFLVTARKRRMIMKVNGYLAHLVVMFPHNSLLFEYNAFVNSTWRSWMETFFDIALIITSIATIVCVVLQNRGVGLGSLGGNEPGVSVFNARRGIEKILFNMTIGFSALLLILVLLRVIIF